MQTASSTPVTRYDLWLALPLGLAFGVFFIAPLALLVIVSFYTDPTMTRFGLDQYSRFLLDPFSRSPGCSCGRRDGRKAC